MMRLRKIAGLLIACIAFSTADAADAIQARRYIDDVRHLTSKEFKGRASGSPELDKAARFLAKEFHKAGLRPVGHSFLQPFPVSEKSTMGSNNTLTFSFEGSRLRSHPERASHRLASRLAVGRRGGGVCRIRHHRARIQVRRLRRDRCRGKIALILRHEPQEFDSDSVFEGRVYSEHSQLFSKAFNARAHGAIAVLYVNDTASHGSDALEKFVSLPGPADPGIPFVQIASEYVDEWFTASGRQFKKVQEDIDQTLTPQSFAFAEGLRVSLHADVQLTSRGCLRTSWDICRVRRMSM